MSRFKQFRQLVGQHMGVDLRRRDIGMSEQRLDAAQVGPALQQVGRISMPQRMRMHTCRINLRTLCKFLQHLRKPAPRQMAGFAA